MDWYDKQGRPITYEELRAIKTDEYARVAETDLFDVWVSTVWLGLDHSFRFDESRGRPVIFETMVFRHDRWHEEWMERYETEGDAIRGHLDIVKTKPWRTGRFKYFKVIWWGLEARLKLRKWRIRGVSRPSALFKFKKS